MLNATSGSLWRKWDLHVHVPGTHQNNAYRSDGEGDDDLDLRRFCEILENSDVDAFGLTDYFDAKRTIQCIRRYSELFPSSEKLLLVNVELRLNEGVNRAGELVDFHLIFNPELAPGRIENFIANIQTEVSNSDGRKVRCGELTREQFASATVSREAIRVAYDAEFGTSDRAENLIYVVAANNNGLRAAGGNQRKGQISDEIDKFSNAAFGSAQNTAWFLSRDRYDDATQSSRQIPVFAGSDAHSFAHLEAWLGKEAPSPNEKSVTWIKADLSYHGLVQTLVEPEERVRIDALRPDRKDGFKVIEKVTFESQGAFPDEIKLNPNLNSIIGSRSSGKSALLAHIAYAVDPVETINRQMEVAGGSTPRSTLGPAAGITWQVASSAGCRVHWAGEGGPGRVIFVPQNSLYSISGRPEEITAKIRPVLEAHHPTVARALKSYETEVELLTSAIEDRVGEWFGAAEEVTKRRVRAAEIGARGSIVAARESVLAGFSSAATLITQEERSDYEAFRAERADLHSRIERLTVEIDSLTQQVFTETITNPVTVEIRVAGRGAYSTVLLESLDRLIASFMQELEPRIQEAVDTHVRELNQHLVILTGEIARLESTHSGLVARVQADAIVSEAADEIRRYDEALGKLTELESEMAALEDVKDDAIAQILSCFDSRNRRFETLMGHFVEGRISVDDLSFGVEAAVSEDRLLALSALVNKQQESPLVDRGSQLIRIAYVRSEPGEVLSALFSGELRTNGGNLPLSVAKSLLSEEDSVRLTSRLDGDSIGGYSASTMTPGKQAMFALSLLLNEDSSGWPLLLDQPEDDLDSRSIFEVLVPFLKMRKRGRQIILVSHNANLVVGADSEAVIVANRHGTDRPNRSGLFFEYKTGALEDSQVDVTSHDTLASLRIRDHACSLLDGGEHAFRARHAKYRLSRR